jgi:hypothetical protein
LAFLIASAEQMRLTSTGLGIGNTAIGSFSSETETRLAVGTGSGNTGITLYTGNTSYGQILWADGTSGASTYSGILRYDHSLNAMQFYTNGLNERMRLDSSGNLGLGVTPSAWGSGVKAFDIGTYGALAQLSTVLNLNYNSFFNGTNVIYKNTGVASVYQQSSSGHIWFNAPSGTAGNTISLTQAMTLDASGNLGVGTTSPNLNTVGTVVHVNNASSGYAALTRYTTGNTGSAATDGLDVGMWSDGDAFFWLRESSNIRFATNSTERARITSGGDLLVGTTTVAGSAKLTVNGDIATSGTGTGSRLRNQIDGVSVSTSATTIVLGGDIGQLVVINGISGSDRFCDLVMSSTGADPVVVQSFTALGSPAARTYTRSGSDLQLAMASGTYTVRALSIGS